MRSQRKLGILLKAFTLPLICTKFALPDFATADDLGFACEIFMPESRPLKVNLSPPPTTLRKLVKESTGFGENGGVLRYIHASYDKTKDLLRIEAFAARYHDPIQGYAPLERFYISPVQNFEINLKITNIRGISSATLTTKVQCRPNIVIEQSRLGCKLTTQDSQFEPPSHREFSISKDISPISIKVFHKGHGEVEEIAATESSVKMPREVQFNPDTKDGTKATFNISFRAGQYPDKFVALIFSGIPPPDTFGAQVPDEGTEDIFLERRLHCLGGT